MLQLQKQNHMKSNLLIFLLFISFIATAQSNRKISKEIKKAQSELNEEFLNSETSILDSLDQITFKGLAFYPINIKYRIEAKFVRTANEKPFLMKTSTDRLPEYVKYGEAYFTLR